MRYVRFGFCLMKGKEGDIEDWVERYESEVVGRGEVLCSMYWGEENRGG